MSPDCICALHIKQKCHDLQNHIYLESGNIPPSFSTNLFSMYLPGFNSFYYFNKLILYLTQSFPFRFSGLCGWKCFSLRTLSWNNNWSQIGNVECSPGSRVVILPQSRHTEIPKLASSRESGKWTKVCVFLLLHSEGQVEHFHLRAGRESRLVCSSQLHNLGEKKEQTFA